MTQLALDHWTFHSVSRSMGGVPTNADWQRLAQHITNRRNALGLTQAQVAAAGGPSVATMRLVEGALQTSYRGSVLGRLEAALQWQPGSIDRILAGGDPTPIRPADPDPQPRNGLEAELRAIADNTARSDHVRQWARDLLAQLAGIRAASQAEAKARGEDVS